MIPVLKILSITKETKQEHLTAAMLFFYYWGAGQRIIPSKKLHPPLDLISVCKNIIMKNPNV